jgi:hypothetical protein
MPLRRQPYQRSATPRPIRITARDKRILETIYAFDGLLSLRQIDRLFFSGRGRSQPRARMRSLFDAGYVQMPGSESIHQVPQGETIYWLDRQGAALVAGLQGQSLSRFKWRKSPRYSLIEHDLRVNDFRITIQEACQQQADIALTIWTPESEFAARPDRVTFETGTGKMRSRRVQPDGYFVIERRTQITGNKPFAFLLEIDMANEDNPRFAREKVRPGIAYLKSDQYARRFGMKHGRYLVVTTGRRRMLNMKAQAERHGGKGLFYFAVFDDLSPRSIVTEDVWLLAGYQEPRSILPE